MKSLSLLLTIATTLAFSQDPVKVDPVHYHVLFENAHMRVLEYRDKPGDKAPMHYHPAYMTYTTAGGKTKVTQPDGAITIDESAGSEFGCHPPTQHATENVGSMETQELLVEFKDATNPCSSIQASASSASQGSESGAVSQALPYSSAMQVTKALQEIGTSDGDRIVVHLEPYIVRAEHRGLTNTPRASASVHKDEAELYYVIEGSATLVTGRLPGQPSGGRTQQIRAGDVLIIPEDTPHWFSAVDQPLSYISMHMPRSKSSSGK